MRIAVTGGAASGKSTLVRDYAERDPERVAPVGEVASDVLREMALSQRDLPAPLRRELQRRIYAEQLRREQAAAAKPVLLLDRGTVDGAAYWPDGWRDFWRTVGTTHERELARYDAVVFLDSAPAHFVNTAWRTEAPAEALRVRRRLLALWRRHPRFHRIPVFAHFEDKAERFRALVDALIARQA